MEHALLRLAAKFDVLARMRKSYSKHADACRWVAVTSSMRVADVKTNIEYLIKLNLKELQKQQGKPPQGVDPKTFYAEMQVAARQGPLFTERVMELIKRTGSRLTKDQARDLADSLRGRNDVNSQQVNEVADWIEQTKPQFKGKNFQVLLRESNLWHSQLANQKPEAKKEEFGPYKTNIVVKRWPDGVKIVSVKDRDDLSTEGELMGHCVGGYCHKVEAGDTTILSLRDLKNLPHVTIELTRNSDGTFNVAQVKGKQNKPPLPKYQPYLREFFSSHNLWSGEALAYAPDEIAEEHASKMETMELENFLLTTSSKNILRKYVEKVPDAVIRNLNLSWEEAKEFLNNYVPEEFRDIVGEELLIRPDAPEALVRKMLQQPDKFDDRVIYTREWKLPQLEELAKNGTAKTLQALFTSSEVKYGQNADKLWNAIVDSMKTVSAQDPYYLKALAGAFEAKFAGTAADPSKLIAVTDTLSDSGKFEKMNLRLNNLTPALSKDLAGLYAIINDLIDYPSEVKKVVSSIEEKFGMSPGIMYSAVSAQRAVYKDF